MPKALPKRTESHNLEEGSWRSFQRSLPRDWTADRPPADYGVDVRVDMFEGERATGLELLVQLKAAAKPTRGEFEKVRMRMSTYNYLWDKLQVVMVVKYVAATEEAYWQLLRNVSPPSQNCETFTISIPKVNGLSKIDWSWIANYVRRVTDSKRAAHRKSVLEREAERAQQSGAVNDHPLLRRNPCASVAPPGARH